MNFSAGKRASALILGLATIAANAAPPAVSVTGTWKIIGDVQGTPVNLTCSLLEADHKLTGACTDSSDGKTHDVTGTVSDTAVTFHFSSAYQGTPITVGLQGTLDATAAKMTGNIAVPEFNVDGDFTAARQTASTTP